MGLVDYNSDGSGTSDGEASVATPIKSTKTTAVGVKKPFQKLVDRANPGRILVNLPSAAAAASEEKDGDARPAKRAKVGAGASSRFSGFGSFLPPPKNAAASAAKPATSKLSQLDSSSRSRPGVNLKTSSEAAFSRQDAVESDSFSVTAPVPTSSSTAPPPKMALPAPKAPSIPIDQKSAEDVKLVGNPLMFMPLSVSRKPGTKKKKTVGGSGGNANISQSSASGAANVAASVTQKQPPPARTKLSLFSLGADDQAEAEQAVAAAAAAQQAAEEDEARAQDTAALNDYSSTYQVAQPPGYASYDGQPNYNTGDASAAAAQSAADTLSLNTIANDLHLSAKERRELFGRTGVADASTRIAASFNMDQEYRHNEALRRADEASANGGQQQSHNPVRTLMPGKHSLRQLVDAVHTQQDALEENFAKNRQSQREAGGKYGWR
ncbi:hypothetical protein SEPCBS57363_000987 [Sporothrix epigloea]|uniref:Stress activated map kinase interacting n=1 Tax=Sporothrix epigloea TaxID=1892477 RepID=A0ABP0D8T8_9PEZI